MDSDLFITFVLHHRGKFLRDEDGELIYDNEEIDVWEDVDPDKCCPWLARDLAKQHGYRDFKEVWWHNKQFSLEKGLRLLKEDVDVRDMCLIARQFDYEAHIYFEHQVDVPVFSKTAQAKESLGSIEVRRETCDAGEGEGDVHMKDIEHAANVEGDVHMGDIQHAAYVEDDMNEDESEASGSNKMSSSDDYESAEDSVYRPSPPLVEESDDGSSEKNEGRDGRSGEETMEENPTLKRSQNFRARVIASKKKKEIPNEAHADSEEEERCGAEGHNSRKCPLPPPPPPPTDTDLQHVAAESNPNPPPVVVVSTPNHGAPSATTHSPRAMPPRIAEHVTQETFNAASTST
ncbi:proteoglycan 4-like [Sesbania bispinosa]|nr:proteoglycan 4-like [Sesbania bispinosa]